MLFNSIQYVIFLPIVLILYFLLPHKYRWILLLAASYYFYMSWRPEYIFIIMFSTLVDYLCGLKMDKLPDKKARLPFLIISLTLNLGLLFFFKYYNFASQNLNELFTVIGIPHNFPLMKVLLPVGISFYTFQALSYTVDVYFGRQKAEKHLGYFALYISYFPQLVAGPIERFSNLTHQLKEKHSLTYDNLANGLRLILYGLFIKMVIADNISGFVDQIYEHPENYATFDLLKGIFFYSFQIYSDFFGYSTIAVGSALIMGVHLMDNFKTPYLSANIAEFWQRWHISLSTWFRDYIYYPLGGNRVAKTRWIINILIVFVVSGIWHGANWTFLIWGSIFGVLYIAEKYVNKWFHIKNQHKNFSVSHIFFVLKTFVLVSLIWIFFRSQNLHEALNMFAYLVKNIHLSGTTLLIPIWVWIFFAFFIASDFLLYNKRFDTWVGKFPAVLRWTIYAVLLFSIIIFSGVENFPFIYFQF